MRDKAKVPEVMLEELRQSPERGLEMRLRHPAFALLIDDIVKLFDECGGTNFVEFAGQSEKHGKFSVCIQRLEGKTPAMMHTAARARIAELERERAGLLAAVRELFAVLDAHEIDTFDCDRAGVVHCDCLERARKRVESKMEATPAQAGKGEE